MIPQPRSLSMLMIRKRCSTSSSVSEEVGNLLTLNSYIDTLLTLSLVFGIEPDKVDEFIGARAKK